jgi:hypothetical protein
VAGAADASRSLCAPMKRREMEGGRWKAGDDEADVAAEW